MKTNKEEWNRRVYEYPFREKLPPKTKLPSQSNLENQRQDSHCEDQNNIKYIVGHVKRVKRQIVKKLRGVYKNIKNILEKV